MGRRLDRSDRPNPWYIYSGSCSICLHKWLHYDTGRPLHTRRRSTRSNVRRSPTRTRMRSRRACRNIWRRFRRRCSDSRPRSCHSQHRSSPFGTRTGDLYRPDDMSCCRHMDLVHTDLKIHQVSLFSAVETAF